MITYDDYIKPLIEATEAIEKVAGRDEAYRFAMSSLEQTENQLNNSFLSKIIGIFIR